MRGPARHLPPAGTQSPSPPAPDSGFMAAVPPVYLHGGDAGRVVRQPPFEAATLVAAPVATEERGVPVADQSAGPGEAEPCAVLRETRSTHDRPCLIQCRPWVSVARPSTVGWYSLCAVGPVNRTAGRARREGRDGGIRLLRICRLRALLSECAAPAGRRQSGFDQGGPDPRDSRRHERPGGRNSARAARRS
jgi:hypothetical protein